VTAVLESTTVGVARWQRHEAVVELEQLIVSPEHRGVGVGTRLLDFVEGRARLSQGRLVVANLDPASDLARYVVGRGYLQMGDLAVFGDERRGFGRVLS
jgi:GNAT superfamily N-acetyltransferase